MTSVTYSELSKCVSLCLHELLQFSVQFSVGIICLSFWNVVNHEACSNIKMISFSRANLETKISLWHTTRRFDWNPVMQTGLFLEYSATIVSHNLKIKICYLRQYETWCCEEEHENIQKNTSYLNHFNIVWPVRQWDRETRALLQRENIFEGAKRLHNTEGRKKLKSNHCVFDSTQITHSNLSFQNGWIKYERIPLKSSSSESQFPEINTWSLLIDTYNFYISLFLMSLRHHTTLVQAEIFRQLLHNYIHGLQNMRWCSDF